jgi:FkbM family methyltransferase
MLNELLGRDGVHEYRLSSQDATTVLRHNGYDAHVLHEVVRDPFYTPPEPVQARLANRNGQLRVLDLGGNIGCYGLLLLHQYPAASLTGFEPDPTNIAILKRCIARNGYGDRWEIVEACAAPHDGETDFVGGQAALSRVPLPGDVTGDTATLTVPMVDVFPYLEGVDLLKIDIEGGEWALLADPRFAAARVAVLEYHPPGCPEPDTHAAARRLLEGHGYTFVPLFEHPGGVGMAWAFRP